eukprot:jgi/Orpsp1_1/1176213/evm.model.c7180000056815.1
MISNERKEPNEKQKIIIFRITDDNHQGQLELYKFFGNEADDTSINLETSPTSVSNLNNNISPRKKSFSYSPSNSISLTSLTNPGDDILNSKIKVQKMIQWDLHRKKNWPPVKLNIKIIMPKEINNCIKIANTTLSSSSKILNNKINEINKPSQNPSIVSSSNLPNLSNISTIQSTSTSLNKTNSSSLGSSSQSSINSSFNSSLNISKENNSSQSGRRKSKGKPTVITTSPHSNVSLATNNSNHQIDNFETKTSTSNSINTQKLLSPNTLNNFAMKNK